MATHGLKKEREIIIISSSSHPDYFTYPGSPCGMTGKRVEIIEVA